HSIGSKTGSVKDFSVFDFDYVPEEPLLREEAKQLIDEILQFKISNIPTHHFIIGSRGSGKTLTLRFLARLMSQETEVIFHYANCRQHNTSYKILAHLLNVPPRGVGLGELFTAFEARAAPHTIVLLDELELMSPKDRDREILYLLSRSKKRFMVIALSNSARVLREVDLATRSSLQPIPVHFRNYDANQIGQILQERARQGLHRHDEAMLAQIAGLTVQRTNSDARVAIKTLYYCVTQLDQSLEVCFERARRDVVIDMIADLSDTALMTLRAVATSGSEFAKDVYARYRRYCHTRGEKPISYVYFCSNLSYLQSASLVALVSTKVGRAYPNRVLLTIDRTTVDQISRMRFE
ncbi:MAG: Cdc6/Cdc18 family protein, partial [Dehalococcoidia bacterium]